MEKTVTIILVNPKGDILLQLRDDTPEIPFPNHWTTPGGFVEEGETFKECIRREMKEELNTDFEKYEQVTRHETCADHDETVFLAYTNTTKETIPINEGQEARFFTIQEAKELDNLCCDALEAIQAYEEFLKS